MQLHSHSRRNTKKQSLAAAPAAHAEPGIKAPQTAAEAIPEVHDDELLHLATDIAYFRATSYREVASDDIRAEDIRGAAAEIAALFRRDSTQ